MKKERVATASNQDVTRNGREYVHHAYKKKDGRASYKRSNAYKHEVKTDDPYIDNIDNIFYFIILIGVLFIVVLVLLVVVDGLVVGQTEKPRYQLIKRAKLPDVEHPEIFVGDEPIRSLEGNLKAVRIHAEMMVYGDFSEAMFFCCIDEFYIEGVTNRDGTAIIDTF